MKEKMTDMAFITLRRFPTRIHKHIVTKAEEIAKKRRHNEIMMDDITDAVNVILTEHFKIK